MYIIVHVYKISPAIKWVMWNPVHPWVLEMGFLGALQLQEWVSV